MIRQVPIVLLMQSGERWVLARARSSRECSSMFIFMEFCHQSGRDTSSAYQPIGIQLALSTVLVIDVAV